MHMQIYIMYIKIQQGINIWKQRYFDSNAIWTHKHLVRKWTFNI